jgi:putative cardiolipin synthase
VDEATLDTSPRFLAFLDHHQNVEIRLYNPTGGIGHGLIGRAFRFLGDFRRANRRMHNKALIVDGSMAIVGGRNIADEYFDLDEKLNFRDRDVLAVGPVVDDIAIAFDDYWNSDWVVPIPALIDLEVDVSERDLYYSELHDYVRKTENFPSRFNKGLEETEDYLDTLRGDALHWGRASIIYDIPGKNEYPDSFEGYSRSGRQLTDLALSARRELIAQTPYLVMLPGTWDVLRALRDREVRLFIHTNSLAVTDATAVHSAYAFQRRNLLDLGVELHEASLNSEDNDQLVHEDTVVALHAKSMVIDKEVAFIGTFNMDPRSTHINTEMGVVIESGSLAKQLVETIEKDASLENSWRVTMDADRRLRWTSVRNGETVIQRGEPDAGFGKKLQYMLLAPLPITPLL